MDTTVILAQPRASRLRADAVCTVCRGSAGQTGAPSMQATGRTFDPPESGPLMLEFGANKSWYCGEIWPPRVSSIHIGVRIRITSSIAPCLCHWCPHPVFNNVNLFALFSKNAPPDTEYPGDSTRVILRQFWAQRSYRRCVSLKCAPIGYREI